MHTRGSIAGIVLAGTYPWQPSAFTSVFPRPLLPIAQRPLMSYAVSWLHDAGIRDVAVCGRGETQTLRAHISPQLPGDMRVSWHEDLTPRGTAGAIRDATNTSDAELFVVVEGTAIPTVSLSQLLEAHDAAGAAITVAVHDDRRASGVTGHHVSTGIYVVNRAALDHVPALGFCDLKESLIPQLYRAGLKVGAHQVTEPAARVMDTQTYLAVDGWMIERLAAGPVPPPQYERIGLALVHRLACVAADAVLVGAVMVGPSARIESGAMVVGPCSIGRDATLEHGVIVSRSAVWRRSLIGERAVVDRTIVCDDAVVEADSENYRSVLVADRRATVRIEAPPGAAGAWRRPAVEMLRRIARSLLAGDPRGAQIAP